VAAKGELVEFAGTGSGVKVKSFTLANSAGSTFGLGIHNPNSHSGGAFAYVGGISPRIDLPESYVSGSQISGTMTFNSATFTSLGISPVPATYTYNLKLVGTGTVDQSATFNVIPEPATVALLGIAGLGGFAMLRRCRFSSKG